MLVDGIDLDGHVISVFYQPTKNQDLIVMQHTKVGLLALQAGLTLALTGIGVTLLYVAADFATQGVVA